MTPEEVGTAAEIAAEVVGKITERLSGPALVTEDMVTRATRAGAAAMTVALRQPYPVPQAELTAVCDRAEADPEWRDETRQVLESVAVDIARAGAAHAIEAFLEVFLARGLEEERAAG